MKYLFITTLLSLNALASTAPAIPGKECRDEDTVPALTCVNPNAGADVRLYLTEFQTCEKGTIIKLDRMVTGFYETTSGPDTILNEDVTIEYQDKRLRISPKDRVDNLSFLLPSKVTMNFDEATVEMNISTQTALDYEGAQKDQFHFKGNFKLVNNQTGKERKGKLNCWVNR